MPDCTLTQKDNTGKNFSDCNFSGQDLSGYIFKSCTLTGTNFSGCKFDASTNFTGALFGKSATNLPTNFSGCDLTAAQFRTPANFGGLGTRDVRTNLTSTILPWPLLGSQFQYVDITGARFTNMPDDLSRIQLLSVTWRNFDFRGKKLNNAHFLNCDLTGCIMTGVGLEYVSFDQVSNLTEVQMNNCSLYYTVFDKSTMTNTNLSYATKMSNCTFLNTLLKGTKFDGNDLTNNTFGIPDKTSTDPEFITSFQFATLSTDFLITNLQKNWQCADFRNVKVPNFSSIVNELYNLQAHNSKFNNTLCFQNAKLSGSNFTGAEFNGVNFNNAFLNNTLLVGAQTLQGNDMGKPGSIFSLAQNNPALQAPNDYTSFLNNLSTSDISATTAVFSHFGYAIGNITITSATDPVSQNPAWLISDNQAAPRRTYMVVKSPLSQDVTQFELLVYDNSPSTFSYANLIGSYLEGCNLSNAKMDHTQLFGATITFANLSNVDLTGAQLGKNAAVFSVAQDDTSILPPYDYPSFTADLQTPDYGKITDVFNHYGYVIGNITCATGTPPYGADMAWQIIDNHISPARKFTVARIIVKQNPAVYELDVFFDDALPATLDNTYMPGIVLTQANLTACSAQGCHLYNDELSGSSATLNHTTLVEVHFENANLYKADFTSAVLSGANFSGANLMGATFKGVVLDAASSGTKVSFNSANLQGVDFSASIIKSGNFLSAAVCMPSSKTQPDETNGVWLHNVPAGSQNLAIYLAELDKACSSYTITQPPPSILSKKFLVPGTIQGNLVTVLGSHGITLSASSAVSIDQMETTWQIIDGTQTYNIIPGYDGNFTVAYNIYLDGAPTVICSFDYNTVLGPGTVQPSLSDTLKAASLGHISLGSGAILSTYQRPVVWSIFDPANGAGYTLWWGVELSAGVSPKLVNVSYVRSSLPSVSALFNSFQLSLRPQTLVTKTTDSTANTTTWTLDMGKEDAYNLNTGYVLCKIVGNSATAPTALDIFGYAMRMVGIGSNQQQIIQDFDCEVTKISADVMDDQTLLPNNRTKIENVNNSVPFGQWMQAYNSYPKPPTCVPTGISYCPKPSRTNSLSAAENTATSNAISYDKLVSCQT